MLFSEQQQCSVCSPCLPAEREHTAEASVIAGLYYEALNDFDTAAGVSRAVVGPNATADIFATYPTTLPSGRVPSMATCICSEAVGTAVLVIGVFALTDRAREPLEPAWLGFMVGQLVLAVGLALGWQTGYAINPARDFGPRVLSAFAGWGAEVFTAHHHYFLIPMFAPLIGGGVGTIVYKQMVATSVAVDNVDFVVQHRRLSMESNVIPSRTRRRYSWGDGNQDEAMALLMRDSPPSVSVNS